MSLRDKIFELKYLGREVVIYGRTYEVFAYNIGARTFDLIDSENMRSECSAYVLMKVGRVLN